MWTNLEEYKFQIYLVEVAPLIILFKKGKLVLSSDVVKNDRNLRKRSVA